MWYCNEISNIDIWKNYKERKLISSENHSKIYQSINIKTGKYVAIKEINKDNINIEELKKEIKRMKNEEQYSRYYCLTIFNISIRF